MKYSVVVILILSLKSIGQSELKFHPQFSNSELVLEKYYKISVTDSLQITTLRFYISGIELLDKNETVWTEPYSYHLLDVSNSKSLIIALKNIPKVKYTRIKFKLGLDSITNVSGAMGGELDPTKGMYWAWQSGYINFKLEGNSNLCNTRNKEFQFHLGGYQYPLNTIQTIITDMPNQHLDMILDIQQLISNIDLPNNNHIMSPCKKAIEFSETIVKSLNVNH